MFTKNHRRFPARAFGPGIVLAALALLIVPAARASEAKVSVQSTPTQMQFRVYPGGRIIGSRTLDVAVSRTEKPSGVFQSCKKVYTLEIDKLVTENGKQKGQSLAQKQLRPGLCNFSKVHFSVRPFTDQEIEQVCRGGNHTLHRQGKVVFWDNYYVDKSKYYNQFDKTYGKANADDDFTFTAQVECGGPKGRPANPRPSSANNSAGSQWRPPVVNRPVGRPVNGPGGVHVNPPKLGQHIQCPAQTSARVFEGINARHQPYPLSGTPWSPGQAQVLSAYRTRVTRLNNRVHLVCYYGDAQHHGAFPLDRLAPNGRSCQSDGRTGFYCH